MGLVVVQGPQTRVVKLVQVWVVTLGNCRLCFVAHATAEAEKSTPRRRCNMLADALDVNESWEGRLISLRNGAASAYVGEEIVVAGH